MPRLATCDATRLTAALDTAKTAQVTFDAYVDALSAVSVVAGSKTGTLTQRAGKTYATINVAGVVSNVPLASITAVCGQA